MYTQWEDAKPSHTSPRSGGQTHFFQNLMNLIVLLWVSNSANPNRPQALLCDFYYLCLTLVFTFHTSRQFSAWWESLDRVGSVFCQWQAPRGLKHCYYRFITVFSRVCVLFDTSGQPLRRENISMGSCFGHFFSSRGHHSVPNLPIGQRG